MIAYFKGRKVLFKVAFLKMKTTETSHVYITWNTFRFRKINWRIPDLRRKYCPQIQWQNSNLPCILSEMSPNYLLIVLLYAAQKPTKATQKVILMIIVCNPYIFT